MNTVIIVLGSNIEPEKNIVLAGELLARRWEVSRQSRPLKTKPVRMADTLDFINQAIMVKTQLNYAEFRSALKDIEREMGRPASPGGRYKPRTIDLDIVVWNEKIMDHDFYTRDFLKTMVLEILPDLQF